MYVCMCVCMYVCIYACIYWQYLYTISLILHTLSITRTSLHTHTLTHNHTHTHKHTHTHTCTHAHTHTRTHTHTHAHTRTHTHTHTHTQTRTTRTHSLAKHRDKDPIGFAKYAEIHLKCQVQEALALSCALSKVIPPSARACSLARSLSPCLSLPFHPFSLPLIPHSWRMISYGHGNRCTCTRRSSSIHGAPSTASLHGDKASGNEVQCTSSSRRGRKVKTPFGTKAASSLTSRLLAPPICSACPSTSSDRPLSLLRLLLGQALHCFLIKFSLSLSNKGDGWPQEMKSRVHC